MHVSDHLWSSTNECLPIPLTFLCWHVKPCFNAGSLPTFRQQRSNSQNDFQVRRRTDRIVVLRRAQPFRSIEDLSRVAGISSARVGDIIAEGKACVSP